MTTCTASGLCKPGSESVRERPSFSNICLRRTHSTVHVQSSAGTIVYIFHTASIFARTNCLQKNIVCKYNKPHIPVASMHIQKEEVQSSAKGTGEMAAILEGVFVSTDHVSHYHIAHETFLWFPVYTLCIIQQQRSFYIVINRKLNPVHVFSVLKEEFCIYKMRSDFNRLFCSHL